MNVPEHLHARASELIAWQLSAAVAERDFWETRLAHEKVEHELRCQKARCNEVGVQIQ